MRPFPNDTKDGFQQFEGVRGRLPTIVCPFCDQRIRSGQSVVRCRNCGEVFESEPEIPEEEYENFF